MPRKRRTVRHEMMRHYRNETERQQRVLKKHDRAKEHMLVLVRALRRLLGEPAFVSILSDEGLHTMPQILAEQIQGSSAR
jgi:ParB family transcriptional regulator, chromosome partitioning protein